jgi:hypothetical protein
LSQGSARAHPENAPQGAARTHSKPEVQGAESASQGAVISPLPAETPDNLQNPQEPSKLRVADVIGDLASGSPQRARKEADLNGDQPIPVDLSLVDADSQRAAARELAKLSQQTGHPVPDGYARRVAAVILACRPNARIPAATVTHMIREEEQNYWPPRARCLHARRCPDGENRRP